MDFVFEQIRVGGDRNFAYLLGDRAAGAAAAVDPAFDPDAVHARAAAQGLDVAWILNTHGHGDHVNGNARLKKRTGAPVAAHASLKPDHPLGDGDVLRVGSLEIHALFTPGHSPDHLVFWLPAQRVAITGDLLFVGKIGGTATEEDARTEFDSLRRVLDTLPDDATVWPGHDYGARPSSTVALERATNPFLRVPDFEAFLRLKEGWARFKEKHGLK